MPRIVLRTGLHHALAIIVALGVLGASAFGILRGFLASGARTAWERATLERAVRWEPDNAFYQHRLAQWEQFSLVEGDFQRALLHYRRATELNPYESGYWLDWAEALLVKGEASQAEAALEKALAVDPRTPRTLWRVGNFWLRAGEPARSLPYFRQAALVDPALTLPVVQACHRALGNPDVLLREVLPPQPFHLLSYLRFLVEHEESAAAARVWKALIELRQSFDPKQALFYLDHLIRSRQLPEALVVWNDLQAGRLLADNPPATQGAGDELLYNPSLRAPILNGGFDWRVEPRGHVSATLDVGRPGAETKAVVVRFSGEDNLHYRHFYQYVPVEPKRRYRLQGWLRPEDITTDSGPRLEIADAYETRAGLAHSPDLLGTTDWTLQQVELVTGRQTRLLRVGVVRLPSSRLDNKIRGTVRATEFSLREVRPGER